MLLAALPSAWVTLAVRPLSFVGLLASLLERLDGLSRAGRLAAGKR